MTRIPWESIPTDLRAEFDVAGLDGAETHAAVVRALEEDLPDGSVDVTSVATIAAEARTTAAIGSRDEGVVAGLLVAALVFHVVLGDEVEVHDRIADGSRVRPGEVVMRVSGPTRGLLIAERPVLNFASHLSGVATSTAK